MILTPTTRSPKRLALAIAMALAATRPAFAAAPTLEEGIAREILHARGLLARAAGSAQACGA